VQAKDFDPVNPSGRARVAQLDLSAGWAGPRARGKAT